MPETRTVTAESLIAEYAVDLAFVAEREPATTLADFVEQLRTVAHGLAVYARIDGAEDLDTAAVYLCDADDSTDDAERAVLLNRAAGYLTGTADMVDEYRLMV
jgi:hypothetical protein